MKMKKLTKLIIVTLLFVVMLFMQNCTNEVEMEELDNVQETSIENTTNSSTSRMVNFDNNNLYQMRFDWPRGVTEEEKQWTRDYYLFNASEYVIIYPISFGTFEGTNEEWAILDPYATEHYYIVMCDGCSPGPQGLTTSRGELDILEITIL